tara:strand:+ start:351 stop:2423 length:2073 start_codon:yes stop_codon:yes gene_type:complete
MTVRHEIKSQLAKLLATEDLMVEHKKVETACFNVHSRVLTLPMWEKASGVVYDMLVGHEVGHALYTPDINWIKDRRINPQIVNVVEDARIEKLMKRRYAGISKSFYRGYHELSEQDFFAIGDDDLNSYNLADKINLYYKIGSFEVVPFTEEEVELVKKVGDCETFEEVLDVAEMIQKFCEQEQKQEIQPQGQSGESEEQTEEVENEDQPAPPQQQESEDAQDGEETGSEETDDQVEVKTMEALEDALKDLVDNRGMENVYVEIPHMDLSRVIVPNAEVHGKCSEVWDEYEQSDAFDIIDTQYQKFKKSAQKEVNYLVKEFECKKAADSYARATTSRTGVLDCSKLHSYKYSEDLFKKVTTLADGKNHGLVFILDWSASMNFVLMDTLKQLFNLMWFCKKVSIPFDVYAFTSEYPLVKCDENGGSEVRERSYTPQDRLVSIPEWFSLMNIFTSKVSGSELEKQMKNVFRVAYSHRYWVTYPSPIGWNLSGTPLNETLVCLHQILPEFKRENKLQKVQCVVLTDGEAAPLKYHRELFRRNAIEPFIGINSLGPHCFLRNRKTGITLSLGGEWYEMTDVLLEDLKATFPDMNFIGIRVLESRDAKQFIRRYCGVFNDDYDKAELSWRKDKAFTIKNSGYHSYFALSANSLSQETGFEVREDATKTQIKSAFVKSLRTKKMNKKILGEFVELVA